MHALPMSDDELAGWLALACARGLGAAALRTLLAAFGTPQMLRAQPFGALAELAGNAAARAVLTEPEAGFEQYVAEAAAWRAQPGNQVVTLCDPAYPPALLTTHDPPPLLYVKGRLELLHAPGIAIVGSRNATPQGLEDAARFARALAEAGLSIVSGLALGIDAAAHRGALDAAGGGTVAVIGTGADIVYPAKHRPLAHEIAARGVIVSEWPLGTPARPSHFPQRNRLIAGLTKGVLVVEAAPRSGSLITARLANEMGRDVFALPGSIHAPLSHGCHQLIKEGAKLTETPDDIFEELGIALAAPGAAAASECAQLPLTGAGQTVSARAARLLDALGHAPATLEILAARTEIDGTALQSALLELELAGHLSVLPGGRFARIARHSG
ncbi:MAG TPA: DNA-processing protein DprA [Trinickia sp.]|nr:DNA-processing protein DprA [Trinickia sp.]